MVLRNEILMFFGAVSLMIHGTVNAEWTDGKEAGFVSFCRQMWNGSEISPYWYISFFPFDIDGDGQEEVVYTDSLSSDRFAGSAWSFYKMKSGSWHLLEPPPTNSPALGAFTWDFYSISNKNAGSASLAFLDLKISGVKTEGQAFSCIEVGKITQVGVGQSGDLCFQSTAITNVFSSTMFRGMQCPRSRWCMLTNYVVCEKPVFVKEPQPVFSGEEHEGLRVLCSSNYTTDAVWGIFSDADMDGRADAFIADPAHSMSNGLFSWQLFLNKADGWSRSETPIRLGNEFIDPQVEASTNDFYRVWYSSAVRDPEAYPGVSHIAVFIPKRGVPAGMETPFAENHIPYALYDKRFYNGYPLTYESLRSRIRDDGIDVSPPRIFIQYFESSIPFEGFDRIDAEILTLR